jgi:hypothetical protein
MKYLALLLGTVSVLILPGQSLAQPPSETCFISQVQGGKMFSQGSLPNKMESFPRDAFVVVRCGNGSKPSPSTNTTRGKLRLTIMRSFAYNGTAQIRLIGGNGVFGSLSPTEYNATSIEVPYSFNGGFQEGKLFYQLQVVATNRQNLEAASNYSVSVNAQLHKQL